MKKETINKNKLITILCAVAITLGVLVSAVLFSVAPVHAEESPVWLLSSNYGQYNIDYNYTDHNGRLCSHYEHLIVNDHNKFYAFIKADENLGSPNIDYHSYKLYSFNLNTTFDPVVYYDETTYEPYYTEYSDCPASAFQSLDKHFLYNGSDMYSTSGSSWYQINDITFTHSYKPDPSSGECVNVEFILPLPVFDSITSMKNYCLTGDKSGMISEPELPNHTDETYSFTGFIMNGKTARWTGTTERSFAKEVDVEEYVKVSYAWATTTEPDKLGELQPYEGEYATSDKQLTLPWSEMEKGKTDFQFIRQVKIFPCYRVPHLAYYIGQPVTIYYNADGSIDKISNPNTPGVLDDSIPIPVLSVNNDDGTFLFANAQNNYKFELKGRFWSTDDFYVFRKTPSLVWQYKYLTLLKNSLTTWVSVGDNMSTLSTYSFGDLGKESWNDLLNTYPIENRNIITGEQQGWFSWANITGYNDAVTTLKTLLSTPYSLFNGYEVYVRYYVVCDDGSIKYSKWTHYFNNLADADGSTGSIVDDASNMNNGSQSDKGLTDSDMDNVENSGNSRNDVDAKPSNDFSVEINDITGLFNQFINILKSLYSGMGQLPSLINAIFGFLPSWVSTMIGISLVVILILRIIGR